jgi:Flp pilus assembly protein TadD
VKTATKIIFASALALSAAAPAFAYETALEYQTQISTTGTNAQHVMGNRTRAHHAMHPMNARAYEPADTQVGVDFGISSQR